MMHGLYRALIRLHPAAFRARFGLDMICTFEDASRSEGAAQLAMDAGVSLARQWLWRETVWKYPAALIAAALVIGVAIRLPVRGPGPAALDAERAPAEFLMVAVLASLIAVSLTTILCVFRFRMANRSRLRGHRRPTAAAR